MLRFFRSLQWKFTLTYTVVTMVILSALFLVLVVITNRVNYDSPVYGSLAASGLLQVAPEAAPALEATPPDAATLSAWLKQAYSGNAVLFARRRNGTTEGVFTAVVSTGTRLSVVDAQGRELAVNGPVTGSSSAAGRALLDQALAGEDRSERLWARDGRHLLVAVPVFSGDERVVGVVLADLVLADEWELFRIALMAALPSTLVFGAVAGVIGLAVGALTARGLSRRLRLMAETTAAWGRGDFSRTLQDRSADELGQLAGDLNRVADELQALLRARQELATLEERSRLARDLHDSVKQQVFAISMNLGAAQSLWDGRPEAARGRVAAALELARQAQSELTELLQALRPVPLVRQGLAAALRELVQGWERQNGIAAICQVSADGPLPDLVEQALFRVAQEALANVARHSGASAASLGLAVTAQSVTLQVSDNGRGFDVSQPRRGLGLRSMQERLQALGGQLSVESGPQGTRLVASLPRDAGSTA